jgi:hypothetical protein
VNPAFLELIVPHLMLLYELNDVVRDLSILKIQAEILTSLLLGGICYSKFLVIQETPAVIVIIFLRMAN